MQRMDDDKQTTIHDLHPGDIFVFNFYGVPHTGVYAPKPGGQGDIIHMYFDKERTGATRSTLSKILLSGKDVHTFRNKKLSGEAIAAQAEFWLNQGIEYDKPRLAESLYPSTDDVFEENNILKYLVIAARRETMPIKVHQFPAPPASFITDLGITLLLPDFNYIPGSAFIGACLAQDGASNPDRPKGMSCVTFVLSCLAAVALKDEINPVNSKLGWISLKHADKNPGLHDLLTDEQAQNFNIERLREKLTPAICLLDPRKPSPFAFYDILRNDRDHWEFIGTVDKKIVKPFDKTAYHREQAQLQQNIIENRKKFIETFGDGIFNRHLDRPERRFTLFRGVAEVSQSALTPCQDKNATSSASCGTDIN